MKYSPLDSTKKGLEAMTFDNCAEKLTRKLASTYFNGYTKEFFYKNLDTSGNQFNYIDNSDIFEIADETNCPITACSI
jgi:hypothetical protein